MDASVRYEVAPDLPHGPFTHVRGSEGEELRGVHGWLRFDVVVKHDFKIRDNSQLLTHTFPVVSVYDLPGYAYLDGRQLPGVPNGDNHADTVVLLSPMRTSHLPVVFSVTRTPTVLSVKRW